MNLLVLVRIQVGLLFIKKLVVCSLQVRTPGDTLEARVRFPPTTIRGEMAKIDHPEYYNWIDVECIDVIEHMTFNLGNAVKYIWRNGKKPSECATDDLRKAIWYLEREISRINKD